MSRDPNDDPNNDVYRPDTEEKAAEEEARKKRDEELFGDLTNDNDIEDLRDQNAELMAQFLKSSNALMKAQETISALRNQVGENQKVVQRIEAQAKEKEQFVLSGFLTEFVSIVDNLERALKSITPEHRTEDPKYDKLAQGVETTLKQLSKVFNQFGVKTIEPRQGDDFDHDRHEALITRDVAGAEPETIVEVSQKGYELNGRLIRPAKVVITPP